jgi:ABC-2 type transport system ATP-binding protein
MQLNINKITKKYGKNYALRDVSIQLQNGVYGLLGANGAGKTTLINILTGILDANEGEVLLDGVDTKKLGTKYLEMIGYMPQYPRFYPNFKVEEFLGYMCCIKGISKKESAMRIDSVLEQVNLQTHRTKKICELSGGMRQRVGIAQAILNDPGILILDEPTAGLDPAERIRFRNIISKIAKNRIVLIATHIVPDIEYIANEVIILNNGLLVKKGTIEDLCQKESGRVWIVNAKENELPDIVEKYMVVNIRREKECVQVRLICNDKPQNLDVCIAEPHLEDIFLDIFEGGYSR